jgi:hypothetical protein
MGGADIRSIQPTPHIEIPKPRGLRSDADVALDSNIHPEANGYTVDGRYRGLMDVVMGRRVRASNLIRHALGAVLLHAARQEYLIYIVPCVKALARAGNDENAERVVRTVVTHRITQFQVHLPVLGIQNFGPVEGKGGDAILFLVDNMFVCHD